MPKPGPKKGSEPSARPAHTRDTAPDHPWDPTPPTVEEPTRARTRVQAPTRPTTDPDEPSIDPAQWRRLVTTEGQRLRAAQRKAAARAADLDAVLTQARHAGIDTTQLAAWLTDAGLNPTEHT